MLETLTLFFKAMQGDDQKAGSESNPKLQIKYACLKNIGALCTLKGDQEDALEAYLEVLIHPKFQTRHFSNIPHSNLIKY